jgi:hypothetical protein
MMARGGAGGWRGGGSPEQRREKAPVRQIHKQRHGEEEEEMGKLIQGSEGRGKHRRRWPSGGDGRWPRRSAAAALW